MVDLLILAVTKGWAYKPHKIYQFSLLLSRFSSKNTAIVYYSKKLNSYYDNYMLNTYTLNNNPEIGYGIIFLE